MAMDISDFDNISEFSLVLSNTELSEYAANSPMKVSSECQSHEHPQSLMLAPGKIFQTWDELNLTAVEYSKQVNHPVTHKGWFMKGQSKDVDESIYPFSRGAYKCARHADGEFKIPYV